MGVDPGLTRCGVGIVDGQIGTRPHFVAVGVVRTSPQLAHPQRLLAIEQGLTEWFDSYQPDVVSIEQVFAQHNLPTVTGVAQVAGIAMLIGARAGKTVALHTPSEVKAALTGSGQADKAQVGAMVARVLGLQAAPSPADAADALAQAITHLWRGGVQNRYAAAAAKKRPTTSWNQYLKKAPARSGTRVTGRSAS
ncbi:crossover junction endodeoxyribonuclease RuvC [Propionibacterium sp.]|uniref:crossover junction endodeoxyribonuclease RuvC n=1 Tax=Propionibacterium sp. TaxID=1977903 RepID=UPI0039E73C46